MTSSVEHMAEFLQRAPQLGFTLGLVELALFRTSKQSDGTFFVQPRVLARTREITRAIVEIRSTVPTAEITVTTPEIRAGQSSSPSARRPPPLSLELFLDELGKSAGVEIKTLAQQCIADAEAHGLKVDLGTGGPILKYYDDSGEFFTFGQINKDGTLGSSFRLSQKCVEKGLPSEIWENYDEAIVGLIPGSRRVPMQFKNVAGKFERIAANDGGDPLIVPLLHHHEEWLSAIDSAVDGIRSALARRLP
jgi:hypothetical protein